MPTREDHAVVVDKIVAQIAAALFPGRQPNQDELNEAREGALGAIDAWKAATEARGESPNVSTPLQRLLVEEREIAKQIGEF